MDERSMGAYLNPFGGDNSGISGAQLVVPLPAQRVEYGCVSLR